MPKRKNPFAGAPPIQLKVHVGAKHVASQEDMEEVYRKTRERLLSNGREKSNGSTDVGRHRGSENGKTVHEKCRCCNGQIGACGHLVCSDCQFKICSSSCVRECCTCGKSFCHFCTVLNYDKAEVRVFCLNCLSSFSFHTSSQ